MATLMYGSIPQQRPVPNLSCCCWLGGWVDMLTMLDAGADEFVAQRDLVLVRRAKNDSLPVSPLFARHAHDPGQRVQRLAPQVQPVGDHQPSLQGDEAKIPPVRAR